MGRKHKGCKPGRQMAYMAGFQPWNNSGIYIGSRSRNTIIIHLPEAESTEENVRNGWVALPAAQTKFPCWRESEDTESTDKVSACEDAKPERGGKDDKHKRDFEKYSDAAEQLLEWLDDICREPIATDKQRQNIDALCAAIDSMELLIDANINDDMSLMSALTWVKDNYNAVDFHT